MTVVSAKVVSYVDAVMRLQQEQMRDQMRAENRYAAEATITVLLDRMLGLQRQIDELRARLDERDHFGQLP